MTDNENGPQMVESPRDRGNLAGGEAANTVAQPGRGWTARRLESPPVPDSWPTYGTADWYALDTRDPRKRLALFEAAESWRLYQLRQAEDDWLLDNDPDEWNRRNLEGLRAEGASTVRRLNIARERTRAELDAAAKPRPPHQLQATPGWPAIRVPGQPDKHLTYKEGRQAA